MTFRNITLAIAPVLALLASCTLKPGMCITMSDCDNGTTCVEGTCQVNAPDTTLDEADADTSTIDTDAASSDTDAAVTDTTDAADAGDASDDADADMTDAASDS